MEITSKAKKLIDNNSKTWLDDKLGISLAILEKRLEFNNWSTTEIMIIISLL